MVHYLILVLYSLRKALHLFPVDRDLIKLPARVCLRAYPFRGQRVWLQYLYRGRQRHAVAGLYILAKLVVHRRAQVLRLALVHRKLRHELRCRIQAVRRVQVFLCRFHAQVFRRSTDLFVSYVPAIKLVALGCRRGRTLQAIRRHNLDRVLRIVHASSGLRPVRHLHRRIRIRIPLRFKY